MIDFFIFDGLAIAPGRQDPTATIIDSACRVWLQGQGACTEFGVIG